MDYDIRDTLIPKNDLSAVLNYLEDNVLTPHDFNSFLGTALYHGNDVLIRTILRFRGAIEISEDKLLEEIYYAQCRNSSEQNECWYISFLDYKEVASKISKEYRPLLSKYNLCGK